jgi:hypothetical protein
MVLLHFFKFIEELFVFPLFFCPVDNASLHFQKNQQVELKQFWHLVFVFDALSNRG